MEVRLLGSVELWRAGNKAPLARSQRRCVLAILAMAPGQPVPAETLIDRVWGSRPPRNALHSLYTHVSAVRRLLGSVNHHERRVVLRRVGGSYALEIDPGQVDLHRARRYVEDARALGVGGERAGEALELLRKSCALWRGTPLAGLTSAWAARVRVGLNQERLALFIERFTLELKLGEHAAAVGPLAELFADHPLAEPLAGLQMLALYRCERQADALEIYAQLRQRVVDELGDEPGPELQRLHERILRRDRLLDADRVATSLPLTTRRHVPPAQLPPDIATFTGRARDLARLDSLLPKNGDSQPAAVVCTISGTAGVGKTALAVHWAHRVKDRFPDGQLYVDLRGFDPDVRPSEPAEVVRCLLEGLQVSPAHIPASGDARIGLYRSLLAGRRMLIVLDNARSVEQVRPLVPGAAGCLVLVTSRHSLLGLVAGESAMPMTLDVLTLGEARQLLERRLGWEWVAADPEATSTIVAQCARLPLALAMVAARVAINPTLDARALSAELDADRRARYAFGGVPGHRH